MFGLVGDDAAGNELMTFLQGAGVNTDAVLTAEAPTGTALITVAGGDNTIVVVAGANGLLTPKHLADFEPEKGDVVVAQYETPIQTTAEAFKKAKASGAITVLNPAPAADVPQELLALVDFLVVNEHEYKIIYSELPDADSLKIQVQSRDFMGNLVVTLGRDGAMALFAGEYYRQAGVVVDAVDSTGAGDCFVGYFAAGLADGLDPAVSIERANRAAAISVTRVGAASSIPTVDEL
jgi:ribokinase